MSQDALGLTYGRIKQFDERVMKNGWPADAFSRALCFSDLGILEFASIEEHVEEYGVILILSEQEAGTQNFGYKESFKRASTAKQCSVLEEIASVDTDTIPEDLRDQGESEVPAIFIADLAVVAGGIYFRNGRYHAQYDHVSEYWRETMRATEDEAHRDANAAVRGHLLKQGFETAGLPAAQPGGQQRETMRNTIAPEMNRLYARAQLLDKIDVPTDQFAIQAARHTVAALQ